MHDLESALENEMHKLLWDFEIQMDQVISARQPDLVIVNNKKEKLPNKCLCRPGKQESENKRK